MSSNNHDKDIQSLRDHIDEIQLFLQSQFPEEYQLVRSRNDIDKCMLSMMDATQDVRNMLLTKVMEIDRQLQTFVDQRKAKPQN